MQFPSPRLALGLAALFLFSPATTTPLEVQRRDTLSSAPFPTASATTSTDYRSPPPSSATVARAAMTPYMYACNKTQKSMVLQAWSEAGQLADAHAKWQPPRWFSSGAYQPAMDMYLGTDSRKDAPWFGTGPLRQNINRQQGIHTTSQDWSPYWSYAYIYCDESQVPSKPKKPKTAECNNPTQPDKSVAAYTFPDDGTIFGWNAKYVVLCPRFFDADILTLEQQTNKARSNTSLQTTIDSWRRVKARSLFHETYHWGPAEVSNPRCNLKPEIYDPKKVTSLATNENVAGSRINAESWALAAVACYVQQTFNLKNPPAPEASSTADVIDDIEEHFFDTAPDWFQSPVSLDASSYAPVNASDPSSASSAISTSTRPHRRSRPKPQHRLRPHRRSRPRPHWKAATRSMRRCSTPLISTAPTGTRVSWMLGAAPIRATAC